MSLSTINQLSILFLLPNIRLQASKPGCFRLFFKYMIVVKLSVSGYATLSQKCIINLDYSLKPLLDLTLKTSLEVGMLHEAQRDKREDYRKRLKISQIEMQQTLRKPGSRRGKRSRLTQVQNHMHKL